MNPCPQCTNQNPEGSVYCQNCGQKLVVFRQKGDTPQKSQSLSLSAQMESGLGPVFNPPKKSNSLALMVIGAIVLSITFLLIIGFVAGSSDLPDGNSLASKSSSLSTPKIGQSSAFPLVDLSLANIDSEWQGYSPNAIFFIKGTINNNNYLSAKNTLLRVDFYWDKDLTNVFDTRYVKIGSAISSFGKYDFREAVTGFSTNENKKFWYLITIISSEKSNDLQ